MVFSLMLDLAWFVLLNLHGCPDNWICMIKLGRVHVCAGHHILPVVTNLDLFMAPFCRRGSKFHPYICGLQKKISLLLLMFLDSLSGQAGLSDADIKP